MTHVKKRILTVGHSYCVGLNRRLAHEMAKVGNVNWEITAVAPNRFRGDFGWIRLDVSPDQHCSLSATPVYFSSQIHCMVYGTRLKQILRSRSWDVVHCWEEPYIVAGGQVACWAPRKSRLVYSTFQNLPKRYPPPFSWIERYAMCRSSGWVALGHTIERNLSNRPSYKPRARRMIPLGVDLRHFRPDRQAGQQVRQKLGWSGHGPPIVGLLGRFIPAKGVDLLLDTLDAIDSPWRALFVGGGPLHDKIQTWGRKHADRVRVVTGVKHDQVPAWLNAMDVLCAPSQTTPHWREQFGRMLLEAFACGVPVVASHSGEIPYVVADAGVIVGEKDKPAWVAELNDLLQNRARRWQLREKGLARVHAHFSWPHIARRHLEFFDELLDTNELRRNSA